jgi:hypothetical protein
MRFRAVLHAHKHLDFGAERATVEFEGLFAAAFEEQVRLD